VTAVCRQAAYPQYSPARTAFWLKVPPFGIILLLLSYLGFILALEFTDNNIDGAQHYQALAIRAAWLAVSQIPLLLLLAGKANLIGALVGVSYERLNVLHRWVARSILLCVTLHFGYASYGWNQYGLMQLEWETDTCPPTGIAAYALLLWLNFSSLAPIRNRFYEIFVVVHILSFISFIYLVMAHLPSTALYSRTYVYIGVGIYFLDRLIRTIRYTYHNIRPGRANLIALDGGVTKVRVQSKQIKSWAPGSHVFLSIPRLGFGQSHPATIISIPSSHNGDLVFVLKCHKGFTSRILKSASISQSSNLSDLKQEFEASSSAAPKKTYVALIGGPYGGRYSDPAAFDTVLLISGSTGVTFTCSNLLSLAHRAQTANRLPLRRVDFVWVVKKVSWTTWISDELIAAVRDLQEKGIEVKITIYVTCDDSFTYLPAGNADSGCTCKTSCNCGDTPATGSNTTGAKETNHDDITSFSTRDKAEVKKTTVTVTTTAISPTSSRGATIVEKQNLPFAAFVCGRPDMTELVWELANQAEGEMGIFTCGPLGMSTEIRRTVARVSDERAVHMGTGAEGIYLHVESFAW
jgi:ferric-chelate reductase